VTVAGIATCHRYSPYLRPFRIFSHNGHILEARRIGDVVAHRLEMMMSFFVSPDGRSLGLWLGIPKRGIMLMKYLLSAQATRETIERNRVATSDGYQRGDPAPRIGVVEKSLPLDDRLAGMRRTSPLCNTFDCLACRLGTQQVFHVARSTNYLGCRQSLIVVAWFGRQQFRGSLRRIASSPNI
jgi:hypothetical protein